MVSLEQKIKSWLEDKLKEEDLYLVDIQISVSFKIEVFVDALTFVNIAQCASISRFLEKLLDEDNEVPENYNLEVSSPGMSNPLKVPQQFKKRIGSILKLQLNNGEELIIKVADADEEKVVGFKALIPEKSKNKSLKREPEVSEEKVALNYLDIKIAKYHFNI